MDFLLWTAAGLLAVSAWILTGTGAYRSRPLAEWLGGLAGVLALLCLLLLDQSWEILLLFALTLLYAAQLKPGGKKREL